MNKRRWLTRFAACALLTAGILYALYPNQPDAFRSLIDHASTHGRTGTLPAEALASLKLPADTPNVPVRALAVRAEGSDHARSFCIRERQGAVDVLLSETYSDRGRFYHCSPDGELLAATTVGPEKLTPKEIDQDFAKELDFWRNWWEKRQASAH